MTNTAILKTLLAQDIAPAWWNHKGWKMRLVTQTTQEVVIAGPAAKVTVAPYHKSSSIWRLNWEMHVFAIGETAGHISLDEGELRSVFGLINNYSDTSHTSRASDILRDTLDAEVVIAGRCVRTGRFVTVPTVTIPIVSGMPDFNVSICLDEEIKRAIDRLIRSRLKGK